MLDLFKLYTYARQFRVLKRKCYHFSCINITGTCYTAMEREFLLAFRICSNFKDQTTTEVGRAIDIINTEFACAQPILNL